GQAVEQVPAAFDELPGLLGRGEVGEFLDIGAGYEAGRLARADDQARGRTSLQLVEYGAEFGQHFGRQGIDGRVGPVDGEPGQAVGMAFEPPMAPGGRRIRVHGVVSVSTSMAPPWPPPMQMAAMPRRRPRACRACSKCRTMRAPDAPTGWPMAMAPPSTLRRLWSSVPQAPVPRCSRQ